MQVSDRVRMADLLQQVDNAQDIEQLKAVHREALRRLDAFMQDLIIQLNSTPTLFTVDPGAEPSKVEGARGGDLAFYMKNGVLNIEMFQG